MSNQLRERLKTFGDKEFSYVDFPDLPHAVRALTRMEKMGEIRCLGRAKVECGKLRRFFVVVKLRKETVRKPRRDYAALNITRDYEITSGDLATREWKRVFPQWFALPAMVEKGRIVNSWKYGLMEDEE